MDADYKYEFNFGHWLIDSIELGGIEYPYHVHKNAFAVFFKNKQDRDAFLELSKEMYPDNAFDKKDIPCSGRLYNLEYTVIQLF